MRCSTPGACPGDERSALPALAPGLRSATRSAAAVTSNDDRRSHLTRLAPSLELGLAALVLAASFLLLERGIHVSAERLDPPFFIDEAHKLGEAFYYDLFFVQRDFASPSWTSDFFARTNPPVAKYAFGAVLALAGQPVRDAHLQDQFERLWQVPDELRKQVPDAMLRISRRISAAFAAGICALLFLIGTRVGGPLAGLAAASLFLAHPVVREQARLGLTETLVDFWMTAIAGVTLRAVVALRAHLARARAGQGSADRLRLAFWTSVAPGVVIGLAAGTKLTGALAGVAYAGGLALAALVGERSRRPRAFATAAAACALAAALALVTFVALDPFFWRDTLPRLVDTLRVYADWTLCQQSQEEGGLFHLQQRLAFVDNFALRNSATLPLGILLGKWGVRLSALAFVVGALQLVGAAAQPHRADSRRDDAAQAAAVVCVWALVFAGLYSAWLPLDWARYLLMPYAAICVVTGLGLVRLPRVAASLGRALARRAASTREWVAWAVGAAAWLLLVFSPWVRRPVDPIARAYGDALELWRKASYAESVPHFERTLALLDREPPDERAANAQRAAALSGLGAAQEALGDAPAAADASTRRIAALRALRAQMVSRDPYVEQTYERLIASEEDRIARLRASARSDR